MSQSRFPPQRRRPRPLALRHVPQPLRERLGNRATFLGWLGGTDLARACASADVFLFASETDTFGQVLLEAQASGLPVVAVGKGGPASLIESGATGVLADPDADALAESVISLLGAPLLRERLRRTALGAVRDRTWEAALGRLASGYLPPHAVRAWQQAGAERRLA